MHSNEKSAPDPGQKYPISGQERVCLLKNFISRNDIIVGDYSYYDDPKGADQFQINNVLYLYEGSGIHLRIGRYCALATGVKFIMDGANHRMDGPSTFPFPIMGGAWADHMSLLMDLPSRGDTIVGHDVWMGYEALVMPGVSIGHGAIIGSRAVVTQDIPPYAVALGNPAKIVKFRFSENEIKTLLDIAWWDWAVDDVTKHIDVIMSGDVAALEKRYQQICVEGE